MAVIVAGCGATWLGRSLSRRLGVAASGGRPIDEAPGRLVSTAGPTWDDRFSQQKLDLISKKPRLVFLGDSNMERWPLFDQPEFDARYGPLDALSLGIGGETTQNLLYRLNHGLFAGHAPRRVVLMIGTNNIDADDRTTDADVARAIESIVITLRRQLPGVRIILFGILPRSSPELIARAAGVNRLIAPLAGPDVTFIDAPGRFLGGTGRLRTPLYLKDHSHLTHEGYLVLDDLLAPALKE